MVDNDLMVVLKGGQNPVLAHLFIQHMLDTKVALANFCYIGYQPPQRSLDPDSWSSHAVHPEEPRDRGGQRGVLQRRLPPARTVRRQRRRVAPDLAGLQGRQLMARARREPDARRIRLVALAAAVAARHRLAAAVLPRAALRRAGDRVRRRRPGVPHAGAGLEPAALATAASSPTSSTTSSARTASSARRCCAPRSTSCVASVLCVAIAFPVAYYVARLAGRRKGLILALLIAPFWISYMMRMLAWVNLLATDGWVNKVLGLGGIFDVHIDWLSGSSVVVDPRPRVRLRAVHDPAAVRGPGPAAAVDARGRARPRREPACRRSSA